MITVHLTEAEALALLRVLQPYVARWNDRSADSARSKIDTALLAHEENAAVGEAR